MSEFHFFTLATISITSDCLWQATMLDGFKSPWQKQTLKGIAWICDTRYRKHLDFKSPQTGRVLLKFRATVPDEHVFREWRSTIELLQTCTLWLVIVSKIGARASEAPRFSSITSIHDHMSGWASATCTFSTNKVGTVESTFTHLDAVHWD